MYLSLYCKDSKRFTQAFTVRGSWTTAIYWSQLLWPSALCLSRSTWLLNRRPSLLGAGFLYRILSPTGLQTHWGSRGPLLPGGGFPYHILSPTRLNSNLSDLQLTDFLSPRSYIIVQSPTQSLEWHVWSSSSGNNSHAVQRSLSSGASVYECIMGFCHVPFRQPNPPTKSFSHNCHRNVSLPYGASLWNGGARGVLVIVAGNGHGDSRSNPGRDWLLSHSTNTLAKGMNPIILPSAMGK